MQKITAQNIRSSFINTSRSEAAKLNLPRRASTPWTGRASDFLGLAGREDAPPRLSRGAGTEGSNRHHAPGPRRRGQEEPFRALRAVPGRVLQGQLRPAVGGQARRAVRPQRQHAGHPDLRRFPVLPQCQGGACGQRDQPGPGRGRAAADRRAGGPAQPSSWSASKATSPDTSNAPGKRGEVSAGRCPRGLPRSAKCPPCPDVRQSPEPSGRRNGWCACPGGSPSPSRGAGRGR